MKKLLVGLMVLSLFVLAGGAQAAAIYKINNSNDLNLTSSWSTTSGSQTPNPAALGTDRWYFNDLTMLSSKTVSLGGNMIIEGIGLDNTTAGSTAAYNVVINSGSTLTLNGGSISGTGVDGGAGYTTAGIVLNRGVGGTLTINCDVALGAAQQWVTSRALTVGGNINLSSYILSMNTAGASNVMTLSGVISGTGGLNKTAGTGTLTLSNTANTFGGQVTLVGGTTTVTKLATVGNNSSLGTGNGASSIIMNGAAMTYNGAGGDTTDRAIDMRASATINNSSATGTISFTAANVIQGGTASARTFTLGGTNTGNNTFNSILGNSGTGANISTLQKNGAGKWIVTGTQAYTGATIINQGTLYVGGSTVLGGASGSTADAGNIVFGTVNSNGALQFETVSNLGAADQVRFRNTGGTNGQGGALVYVGTTSQTLSKTIQCDTSIGMRIESNSVGGELTLNGAFSQTNRSLYLGGTGTGDNNLAMSYAGTGNVTKRDAGTWILSGSNTYTGGTELLGGTLVVDALSRLGNRTAPGDNTGYLAIKNGATFKYTGTGSESTTRRLYMDTGDATINVVDSGATLTWNDDNDSLKNGNFTKTGAGTLVMEDPLTGTGQTVTVNGGTLTLKATNSYTGATTVTSGTLRVDGSITSSAVTVDAGARLQGSGSVGGLIVNGTVAPGNSLESLGVGGNLSLGATSTFQYGLDSASLNGDLLAANTGSLTITSGAILTLTEEASGTLNLGDKLTLISYGGTWNAGLFTYLTSSLTDDSQITLGSNTWLFNYNDTVGGSNFTGDQSTATSFVTMTVIPEPATVGLIGLVGMMALLRRRMKIKG